MPPMPVPMCVAAGEPLGPGPMASLAPTELAPAPKRWTGPKPKNTELLLNRLKDFPDRMATRAQLHEALEGVMTKQQVNEVLKQQLRKCKQASTRKASSTRQCRTGLR